MWQGAREGETKEGLLQVRIPERLKMELGIRAESQRVTPSRLVRLLIEEELASPSEDADERRSARWKAAGCGGVNGKPAPQGRARVGPRKHGA
jgi:hypothetical protein